MAERERDAAEALNVAEAKKRFSDLLGRVAYAGESFLITRRGRPMARLVPVAPPEATGLAHLDGWLGDDDPVLAAVDDLVEARSLHRPRVLSNLAVGDAGTAAE